MSNILNLPYKTRATQIPHIYWVDLFGNGVAVEVAVMAFDSRNGDIYFMRTDQFDAIDKERLRKVLSRRDAARYPLWDLLSQQTLKNGMNALEFFDQFVKVKTASGPIVSKNSGMRGFADLPRDTAFTSGPSFDAEDVPNASTMEKRKPGRPKVA